MNIDSFVTLSELSRATKLSGRYLQTLAYAEEIPSLKIGKRRVFELKPVLDALRERSAKSTEGKAEPVS